MINHKEFWARVQKSEGCWLWTGPKNAQGYGRVSGGKRGIRKIAHRVAWELTYGKIPDKLCVCHHCDNPPCCRPDHLFIGTNGDNVRDAAKKGRLNGRNGPMWTAELRMRVSAALKGRNHTREHIEKIAKANTGKKHKPETIARLKQIASAREIRPRNEFGQYISLGWSA